MESTDSAPVSTSSNFSNLPAASVNTNFSCQFNSEEMDITPEHPVSVCKPREFADGGGMSFLPKFLPRHDEYILCAKRYKSFDSWPKFLLPKKEDLAKAGFVYSGESDMVYCFCCGIYLRDWEPQDKPWTEHYKHSSKCVFLNMCKIPPSKDNSLINKGIGGIFVGKKNTSFFNQPRFQSGHF